MFFQALFASIDKIKSSFPSNHYLNRVSSETTKIIAIWLQVLVSKLLEVTSSVPNTWLSTGELSENNPNKKIEKYTRSNPLWIFDNKTKLFLIKL